MDKNLSTVSLIDAVSLIDVDASSKCLQSYRVPSRQLIAFAALIVLCGCRAGWESPLYVNSRLKKELRDASIGLGVEKSIYENYISSIRRIVSKMSSYDHTRGVIFKVNSSKDEGQAILTILEFMSSVNIFTPNHIKIWSLLDGRDPLDLARKTGDSARYRKGEIKHG